MAVVPGPARADLRDAAARVSDEWRAAGATVAVGPTHFISEEETMALALPPAPEQECTSVMLLGARGISFHARIVSTGGEEEEDEDERGPRASAAGALMISRCGGSLIRRVVITSDGGRGAIEMLVGRSPRGPEGSFRPRPSPESLQRCLRRRSGPRPPSFARDGTAPSLLRATLGARAPTARARGTSRSSPAAIV
jgi:hypothetical protein